MSEIQIYLEFVGDLLATFRFVGNLARLISLQSHGRYLNLVVSVGKGSATPGYSERSAAFRAVHVGNNIIDPHIKLALLYLPMYG